jgi:signal recognition particle subunit SRP9
VIVTDSSKCLMYKSFSSIILNRFESLNLRLLSQIANVRPKARLLPVAGGSNEPSRAGTPGLEGDDPMVGTGAGKEEKKEEKAGPPAGEGKQGGGGQGAGGKKKKKGKR